MKVKNIILATAKLLSLNEIIENIDNIDISQDVESEIDNMVLAVNMINNTIASNYIELIDSVTVDNKYDKIPFDQITDKSIIEIKSITNNNIPVDYKIYPDGVKCLKGNLKIEYSYFPKSVTFDDDINHYLKVNELIFAQGVAGEYLFIKGIIDDAYMWDKRFKQSMFGVIRPKRYITVPAKRWL